MTDWNHWDSFLASMVLTWCAALLVVVVVTNPNARVMSPSEVALTIGAVGTFVLWAFSVIFRLVYDAGRRRGQAAAAPTKQQNWPNE